MKHIFLLSIIFLSSCSKKIETESNLVSIQITDQNGLSETISTSDKLSKYQQVDFTDAQPYQKVFRVFKKDSQGKSKSILTTYYPNGQIEQYLECTQITAFGAYRKWYANGQLNIEAQVIGGPADITPLAQRQWLFEGESKVYDEDGNLSAKINYSKGLLEGLSTYYYTDGKVKEEVNYKQNYLAGKRKLYRHQGVVYIEENYLLGVKSAEQKGFFNDEKKAFLEFYSKGLIETGIYYDEQGKTLCKVQDGNGKQALYNAFGVERFVEYKAGVPDGLVEIYSADHNLIRSFNQLDGKKQGIEKLYYPDTDSIKLTMQWDDDTIHGSVKTYYLNGKQESQKEMSRNKKNGMSFAWYENGDLMLMEEYDNDALIKGTYYEKGDSDPISKIQNGSGVATLFEKDGSFLRKVTYKKGEPVD